KFTAATRRANILHELTDTSAMGVATQALAKQAVGVRPFQPHPTGARVISRLAFAVDCFWRIELCDTINVEATTHAKRNPSTDVGSKTPSGNQSRRSVANTKPGPPTQLAKPHG
ncbi:MAG: hypothetical protein ACKPKO_22680, partial [Candidatus Fonsibacter sp.]